jgi:hypothetical protein
MNHALIVAPVDSSGGAVTSQPPKLLDRLRLALEGKRFAADTVARFVEWNRRFIVHHHLRQSADDGARRGEKGVRTAV